MTEHKDKITALLLLKNNSLVSASLDSLIKVWNQKDENSFECIATLDQSIEVSLALYGSSLLISGHIDGTIQIRNQTSFVLLQTLEDHSDDILSIISLDNENLAFGSFQEIMILQKVNETSFNLSKTLKVHNHWITSLVVRQIICLQVLLMTIQ